MIRADRYLRSSSSDAYDLRTAEVALALEGRGGSESENEPPPKVTADVGVGVRDLLMLLFGACEEDVRVPDREDLEFVGEFEERLEEDASSNAGNGEKEDGIVSCGGCARPCGRSAGEGDALHEKIRNKIKTQGGSGKGGMTDGFGLVEGLGVDEKAEGGVGDLRGVGAAGDFLRKLKRGILRLALDEVSGVEEEEGMVVEEC